MDNVYLISRCVHKKGGFLSIKQFTILLLGHEFQPYGTLDEDYKTNLKISTANWFWCSPNPETNGCTNLRENGGTTNAAMLNWISSMESARKQHDAVHPSIGGPGINAWKSLSANLNIYLATEVFNYVLYESPADGHKYVNQPFSWANLSLPLNPDILGASQGYAYNQYVGKYGRIHDPNPAYILTPCQGAYWTGDNDYLNKFCGIK
jgi:hypothetical protein